MAISPVGLYDAVTNPLNSLLDSTSTIKKTGLDRDMFLKLMITQLQNQDPTKPMDSSEFASQLAQYSSLEQMTTLNKSIAGLVALQTANESVAMIGKTIAATNPDTGETITGQVIQVKLTGGMPSLLLDSGWEVDLSPVTTVM